MKTTTFLILFVALISVPASAQEEAAEPDYSRENLQRFVSAIPEPVQEERRIRFSWGSIEFDALGQRWLLSPVMPLSGTGLRTTQEWPDPFALTGTAIPMTARAWRTQRQMSAEIRRIEKTERARITVR